MNGRAQKGRDGEPRGGEPSRWLESNPAAAGMIEALAPAVLPQALTSVEAAHLASKVSLLAREGRLPGRTSARFEGWPLKAGLLVTVGLAAFGGARWYATARDAAAPATQVVVPAATSATSSSRGLSPVSTSADAPLTAVTPVAPQPLAVATTSRFGTHRARGTLNPGAPRNLAAAEPLTPRSAEDSLAIETRLLDEARELLVEAPRRALGVLGEHRRRFARGQLEAEREFMSIEALVRVGRTSEARQRAQALEVAHPQSSYVARAARLLDAR